MNEMHDVDVLNQGLQGEYFGIAAYMLRWELNSSPTKSPWSPGGSRPTTARMHKRSGKRSNGSVGGRTQRRRGRSTRHSTRHPSWRAKSTSCATRHRWSAARRSPTRRRWRRSMIRLCGRCSHGSAVSRPCTGRSLVRPSGSRRFRTASVRLNEQHRFRRYIASEAGGASRSAEKTPQQARNTSGMPRSERFHFRNALIQGGEPIKAMVVTDQTAGTAGMKLVDRPEPQGAALASLSGANYGDVVVQVHASGFTGGELSWPPAWFVAP